MGQKVHPVGIRLGITATCQSKWYKEGRDYAETLHSDILIRSMLKKKLATAGISRIDIDRPARDAKITIHAARPGIIIGKSGRDIESLRQAVTKLTGVPAHIDIKEVRKPDINAYLVGESIKQQLEKRVPCRRAMKRALANAMRQGAKGVKINIAGRLNGAEIARSEWTREGRVPLHTFRANIDYALVEAHTTYGVIGIKVWVFTGEASDEEQQQTPSKPKKVRRSNTAQLSEG
ncbi:MAG: 30S ribosomal protein S3 [Pseudomonadota bacterium]